MFIFRPYDLMNKNQPSDKLLSSVVGILPLSHNVYFLFLILFFLFLIIFIRKLSHVVILSTDFRDKRSNAAV